jgi:hypothetical protein
VKRWWAAYLFLGLAGAAVHLHFAATESAPVRTSSLLWHFGLAFALYLGALRAARRLGESGRKLPVLWVFAVALVVLLGYVHAPFLVSHEVDRYRWEGMVARQGLNPYQVSPQDPEAAELRAKAPFTIPYPEHAGLYPPLAELTFYGMARAGTDSVVHYRLLSSMMVILSGLVFLPLCRAAHVPITRLAVFLWHPLLLMEAGLNAHIEPLAIFFLLSSLALLIEGHELTPTSLLALATLVRGYPIIFFPLYLRRVPPYRILLFFLIILAGCLPFIAAGSSLLKGLEAYATTARHNPGLFVLLEHVARAVGHPTWALWIAAGLGFCIALAIYITDDGSGASILRCGFYLALPALLLGPVVVPWSVLWLIPFVALVGPEHPLKLAGLVLTGTVILGYLGGPEGRLPVPLALLEFLPPVLLAAYGIFIHVRRGREDEPLALPPAGAC